MTKEQLQKVQKELFDRLEKLHEERIKWEHAAQIQMLQVKSNISYSPHFEMDCSFINFEDLRLSVLAKIKQEIAKMTREEEIMQASATMFLQTDCNIQETVLSAFQEGARWADKHSNSPWISVKDDLPCNPPYLKQPDYSPWVLAITEGGEILFAKMTNKDGKWVWHNHHNRVYEDIRHWMPLLSSLPKEYENIWNISH